MNRLKAEFFDSQKNATWAASEFSPDELQKIRRMLKMARLQEGMRVIEPGCGTGRLTAILADIVGPDGYVYASDISAGMIDAALKRIGSRSNVCLECASIESHSFEPQTFDVVICHNVFPHFDHKQRAVSHLVSTLRIGGRFIVSHFMNSAEINDMHRKTHASVLEDVLPCEPEMREMLEAAGLRVDSFQDDDSGYLLCAILPSIS